MMSDSPGEEGWYQAANILGSLCELGHCEIQAAQGAGATNGFGGTHQESRDAGSAPVSSSKSMIRDAISSGSFGMMSRWN